MCCMHDYVYFVYALLRNLFLAMNFTVNNSVERDKDDEKEPQ